MSQCLSPGDYLPHDAPVLPLEEVVSVTDEAAACHVAVLANSVLAPFLDLDGGLPYWFALELMARTIGIWSSWHRQQQGQANITLGMVLDARKLVRATGALPAGRTSSIRVKLLMRNVRSGNFKCATQADNEMLTTGRVNAFQPASREVNTLFQQGAPT